jgi:hypothetical protein
MYWIRYDRSGESGYCQRFGLDSPRSTYPKAEAEAKAARLEASSDTGTKYSAEIAIDHHDECAWAPGNDECCSCAGRGAVPSNSEEGTK